MSPEDELAERIRRYVASQVPADQVEVVSRTVVLVIATLMQDPRFFGELEAVKVLRQQIAWLQNQNVLLQQVLASRQPAPRKAAAKKAPVRKKAAAKRYTRSFQQGVRDITG